MDGKKNVNIWKTLQKVPAGTMFVPLIIGALITTVCQGMLHFDLWATLGNPMQDMFSSSGQMLLIGLMLFCTGTQLKISKKGQNLLKITENLPFNFNVWAGLTSKEPTNFFFVIYSLGNFFPAGSFIMINFNSEKFKLH